MILLAFQMSGRVMRTLMVRPIKRGTVSSQVKKVALMAFAASVCWILANSSSKPIIHDSDDNDLLMNTCSDSMPVLDIRNYVNHTIPVIYFITPTYARREQVADLTRLFQTLLHINNLVWIIAEDSERCSNAVSNTVSSHKKIPYVHLASPSPKGVSRRVKGVSGKNAGVAWILDNESNLQPGVIYFGDDDNTYDLDLFEEIRWTKKVSMFPVAFVGPMSDKGQQFSSPIVQEGKVVGFSDPWFGMRKFPVYTAGFAVNIDLVKKHRPKIPYIKGYEDTSFLENMKLAYGDIEPLANGCTEVLVWHTQTKKLAIPNYKTGVRQGQNLDALMHDMSGKGMLIESSNGTKPVKVCLNKEGCKT